MHPDEIEEMDYAANAHHDYMWEAYGAEAAREARIEYEMSFWDSERECDVRDIPTVCEARHDPHVVRCVSQLLFVLSSFLDPDNIPF